MRNQNLLQFKITTSCNVFINRHKTLLEDTLGLSICQQPPAVVLAVSGYERPASEVLILQ